MQAEAYLGLGHSTIRANLGVARCTDSPMVEAIGSKELLKSCFYSKFVIIDTIISYQQKLYENEVAKRW